MARDRAQPNTRGRNETDFVLPQVLRFKVLQPVQDDGGARSDLNECHLYNGSAEGTKKFIVATAAPHQTGDNIFAYRPVGGTGYIYTVAGKEIPVLWVELAPPKPLTLKLFNCSISQSGNSYTCGLNATPFYSGQVTELNIKSGCQVGDVRAVSPGPDIRLECWTFAVAAGSNWTFNSENTTWSETMPAAKKPVTSVWFSNGLVGSGGDPEFEEGVLPDGAVEFTVTESAETRNDRGEVCGGKVAKVTAKTPASQLLKVRWDPNPNTTDVQDPTRDIYLKDTANRTESGVKKIGIDITVNRDDPNPNRKITVTFDASAGLNNLTDVDLDTAARPFKDLPAEQYPHGLIYNATANVYQKVSQGAIQFWEHRVKVDGDNRLIQRHLVQLRGFFDRTNTVTEEGWETLLKLTPADTVNNVEWDTTGTDPKLRQAKRSTLLVTVGDLPAVSNSDIVTFKPCNTGGS